MNKSSIIRIITYYLDPPLKLRFNESIKIRVSRIFNSFVIVTCTATIVPTLNKNIILILNVNLRLLLWTTILFFIDIGKDRTMSNDATTSSSFLVTLIQDEKFKKHQLMWMFLNNRAKKIDRRSGVHLNSSINVGLSHVT
jgi:hypothetical protein